MRENRINWPQFFRPVCVLCMVCGGLWLWWQMSLTENLLGRITAIAGGVLFLLGGLFGCWGSPVPWYRYWISWRWRPPSLPCGR